MMNDPRANIILVDDNNNNLKVLAAMLMKHGYEVRPTNNGEMAISAILRKIPELILLDIMMPGMSGYEVCERLKKNEETRDIPVIFISALDEVVDKVRGLSLGAVDYITKPFQEEEVLARVETHLNLRRLQKDLQEKNSRLNQEISLRRRSEELLRHSELQKKAILDGISSNIWFVNEELDILWANKAALDFMDRSLEEIIGQKYHQFQTDSDKPCENCPVLKAFNTKTSEHSTMHSPDGQIWDLRGEPVFDPDGKVTGVICIAHNITETVRMEEIMFQAEKMLSVGGLAAGMAHEINNPLAGMLQNAQVVLKRISEDLPGNRRAAEMCGIGMDSIIKFMEMRDIVRMLESIRDSGERAARIVDNLISFSRGSDPDMKPVDLKELMDRTVELAESDYDLKERYPLKQMDIVREYDPDLPHVPCQEIKIQQVLLNLIKNGVEAMRKNISEINAPRFILRILRDNGMIRMEVEDNGYGMGEEVRKRIFEPFYTSMAVGQGTGLGLSVSYFIITRDHGGTMTVESTLGKGTKFIIRLPTNNRNSLFVDGCLGKILKR